MGRRGREGKGGEGRKVQGRGRGEGPQLKFLATPLPTDTTVTHYMVHKHIIRIISNYHKTDHGVTSFSFSRSFMKNLTCFLTKSEEAGL